MKITTDSSTIAKIQEQLAKIEPSISEEYNFIWQEAKSKLTLRQRFQCHVAIGKNIIIEIVLPEKYERALELDRQLRFIEPILKMIRFDQMNLEENVFVSLNEKETKFIFKAAEAFNFKVKTYLSEQNTPINSNPLTV